jgi:hypothetical protein
MSKAAMRKSSIFIFVSLLFTSGFTLSGCQNQIVALVPPQVTTQAPLPASSSTPSASKTIQITVTLTPSSTATIPPTETGTPTQTEPAQILTYKFPIQPIDFVDFADGVSSHGYPATDIFAPEGTSFISPVDGVVDFVSTVDRWEPVLDDPALRCGLCISVIGLDGVRYYGAHLSSIQPGIHPGVNVQAGQVLGTVGHSGDALIPCLTFILASPIPYPEDWKTRRSELNPYPFLIAWQEGISVTHCFSVDSNQKVSTMYFQ